VDKRILSIDTTHNTDLHGMRQRKQEAKLSLGSDRRPTVS